ncbi:hypothetical protein FJD35_30555 [Pseudomonas mandelii]|nr:hypothetical protein FJD35_30555 [Pseudomonas mandelii]
MDSQHNPCGSEPARDEAVTFNINVDCHTAIASRLAPTVDSWCSQNSGFTAQPMWERACSR